MTEARRRFRVRRALLVTGAVALSACVEIGTRPTPPRLLDLACKSDACIVAGSVHRTTGPTADTLGFHFGPGAGSLSIPLDGLLSQGADTSDLASLEALVSGHGTLSIDAEGGACGPSCGGASETVQGAYDWVHFDIEPDGGVWPGATDSGDAGYAGVGVLVLRVANDGSEFDLADLRYTPGISCSVVAPGY